MNKQLVTVENLVARILTWDMSPRIISVTPGHGLTTFQGRGRPGLVEMVPDAMVDDAVRLLREASGQDKVEVQVWAEKSNTSTV